MPIPKYENVPPPPARKKVLKQFTGSPFNNGQAILCGCNGDLYYSDLTTGAEFVTFEQANMNVKWHIDHKELSLDEYSKAKRNVCYYDREMASLMFETGGW